MKSTWIMLKTKWESNIEKFLYRFTDQYFATVFEDVRHERSLIFLLSLTIPNIVKQSRFTDDEIYIMKNLALEKVYRQRKLTEEIAIALREAELE